MSGAEIRTALIRARGDTALAARLLSEPMAGPARRRDTVVPKIGNVIVKRDILVITSMELFDSILRFLEKKIKSHIHRVWLVGLSGKEKKKHNKNATHNRADVCSCGVRRDEC